MVAFQPDMPVAEEITKPKVTTSVQKKPSAPSSSAVKIMSAVATSDFSIPTPEVETDTLSTDFGESEGFGDGWGSGNGFGSGGAGGGQFSFMGQTGKADDTVFVIDWSHSMTKNQRGKLLKAEMRKTFEAFPANTKMQMIMFAGPVWLLTDDFEPKSVKDGKYKGPKYDITMKDTVGNKTYV